jgi:hypothetical protein
MVYAYLQRLGELQSRCYPTYMHVTTLNPMGRLIVKIVQHALQKQRQPQFSVNRRVCLPLPPLLLLCGLGFHSPAWFVSAAKVQGPVTAPLHEAAGGYTLPERHWRYPQQYLFSCKASPLGFLDSADPCAALWDLLRLPL